MPTPTPIPLLDLVPRYCDQHPYGVSRGYRDQLRYSVLILSTWLKHEATLADCSDDQLSLWVDFLRGKYSPDTARTQRGNVLTIWRWAFETRLTDAEPRRVRRVRIPPRRPIAWTPIEVARLADEAGRMPGRWRGTKIRRGPNLRALVLADWSLGIRLGDLLRVRCASVAESRVVEIRQHKTGVPVVATLSEIAWLAIACTVADEPARDLVWPQADNTYQTWIRTLRARIPIRPGSIKWIRRAAATAAEREHPGDGSRVLGHLRADTARYYLDRSQLDRPIVVPALPDIGGAE